MGPHCTAEDFRFAISAKLELVILRDRGQIRTRGGQRKRESSEAMGRQKRLERGRERRAKQWSNDDGEIEGLQIGRFLFADLSSHSIETGSASCALSRYSVDDLNMETSTVNLEIWKMNSTCWDHQVVHGLGFPSVGYMPSLRKCRTIRDVFYSQVLPCWNDHMF